VSIIHYEGGGIMNSPKKIVSLCIALLGLAAVAVIVTTGTVGASPRLHSIAAAPPTPAIPVTVANTPLPVTGNVSATINGTPTVNLTNSSNNPLFVRDVDNARQPILGGCPIILVDTSRFASCNLSFTDVNGAALTAVPLGKRLVIEWVSGEFDFLPTGSLPLHFALQVVTANAGTGFSFVPTKIGAVNSAYDQWQISQQTRLYSDPGSTVSLSVLTNTSAPVTAIVQVSGYFVDVP
jgi:hypothetical protein